MTATRRNFYKDLPAIPAGAGSVDGAAHVAVPEDWYIVVADIVASTKAIAEGKYKDVNMVSASAITAVLNVTGRADIAYIFGGDGATLLVPAGMLLPVAQALQGTRRMAKDVFGLEMRAGVVSIAELSSKGASVRVAKTETAPRVYQAALSGAGVSLAENLVKGAEGTRYDITALFPLAQLEEKEPDFRGLQCRWQPLQSRNGADISLIVWAREGDPAVAARVYNDVLATISDICGHSGCRPPAVAMAADVATISDICGHSDGWRPASAQNLQLSNNPAALKGDSAIRSYGHGTFGFLARLSTVLGETLVGRLCIALGLKFGKFDGKTYPKAVAQNTDYMKFDNALRLVMDITPFQQKALTAYLEEQRAERKIFYGLHAAKAALMTCLVFDLTDDHFHFVDGADGGYALAAVQLKQQIKDAAQG